MKKVHLFCGNDDLRPAMKYVQFKGGYFYATDAHILGKFAASEIFDIEGMPDEFYILASDFKQLAAVDPMYYELNGNVITATGKKKTFLCPFMTKEQFNDKVGRFPDCDSVLPSLSNMQGNVGNVCLNAKMISRISDAMGCESLQFMFHKNMPAAIYVTPVTSDDYTYFAIIMPVYIEFDTIMKARDVIAKVNNDVSETVNA